MPLSFHPQEPGRWSQGQHHAPRHENRALPGPLNMGVRKWPKLEEALAHVYLTLATLISCKFSHLLRLFWSRCLWRYLCHQPFSLFEVLCLHRTDFVLTLLTDLICFPQLGITAETQGETEKRLKKSPGSERSNFTCWASMLLRRYRSPLPSPVPMSEVVKILLLYVHLFCVSRCSVKDKMLKQNGIILALRHSCKIPQIISKLVGRFLSDYE